jgi:ribosomal protein L21
MAVEPGQKAKVTAPIVEDGAVKAKVHEVQRTASV